MRKFRVLGLAMVLVLGAFLISCGEDGQEDLAAAPGVSQQQASGYEVAASNQIVEIPEVDTIISSKPPKVDCNETAQFAFTCDRERICKGLGFTLPAFLKPFCKCTYECKLNFDMPVGAPSAFISIPKGWYNCSSPTEVIMPSPYMDATFRVRATDALGMVDPTPAKYSWGNRCD